MHESILFLIGTLAIPGMAFAGFILWLDRVHPKPKRQDDDSTTNQFGTALSAMREQFEHLEERSSLLEENTNRRLVSIEDKVSGLTLAVNMRPQKRQEQAA